MSRAVEKNDWCITTGEDWREVFIVGDPTLEFVENPAFDPDCTDTPNNPKFIPQPKDLSGYDVKMDIREGEVVTDTIIQGLRIPTEITIGNPLPLDGTVELFLTAAKTKAAAFISNIDEDVFFDLFLIPPSGDNVKLLFGKIKIIGATTDV